MRGPPLAAASVEDASGGIVEVVVGGGGDSEGTEDAVEVTDDANVPEGDDDSEDRVVVAIGTDGLPRSRSGAGMPARGPTRASIRSSRFSAPSRSAARGTSPVMLPLSDDPGPKPARECKTLRPKCEGSPVKTTAETGGHPNPASTAGVAAQALDVSPKVAGLAGSGDRAPVPPAVAICRLAARTRSRATSIREAIRQGRGASAG